MNDVIGFDDSGKNRDAIVARWHDDLIRANETFQKNPRQGAIEILEACYRNAEAFGLAENGELVPLMHLQAQLNDLERGIVGALVQPTSVVGRPGKSSALQGLEVFLVLCVDLLVKAGEKLDLACSRVAREARKQGFEFPGDNDAKTLKEWRYEKSKWSDDSQKLKTCRGIKEQLGEFKNVSPEEAWPALQVFIGRAIKSFVLAETSESD